MIRSLRILLLLLTAVACLGGPAIASANLVPNSGFEANCGAPLTPCDWTLVEPFSSFTLDGLSAHSGSAGGDLVSTAPVHDPVQSSSCVGGVVAGKTYTYSAWYRTQAPIVWVSLSADYYSDAACNTQLSNPGGAATASPIHDGAWHFITGTASAPAGATKVSFMITFACSGLCFVGTGVSFDDLSLDIASPTAVGIRSFTATRSPVGTLLRWRTASEPELAGFNVLRRSGGRWIRVNGRLIAAKGDGARYRLLDRHHRGGTYRLQSVALNGTTSSQTVVSH
jgi:hypothetical protein